MIINSKNLLDNAKKNKKMIIHANVTNMEHIRSAINAAEKMKSPIILALAEEHEKYLDIETFAFVAKYFASNAKVDIVIHLDHGYSIETIQRALRSGFTSVMIDGSQLPLEDNILLTNEVVTLAKAYNASVEAEIGHVGVGSNECSNKYTTVEEALIFTNMVEINSLAVSVGTAHGEYNVREPQLQFDLMKKLSEQIKIPLVLHGGSGTGMDNLKKSRECGINKLNVHTDLLNAAGNEMKISLKEMNNADALLSSNHAFEECLIGYIKELSI